MVSLVFVIPPPGKAKNASDNATKDNDTGDASSIGREELKIYLDIFCGERRFERVGELTLDDKERVE